MDTYGKTQLVREFDEVKYFDFKEKILTAIRDVEARLTDGSAEFSDAMSNALEDYWD